jgi:hypothetical protein
MNLVQELEHIRSEILKTDASLKALIRRLESYPNTAEKPPSENFETIYPITVDAAIFKGKKPTAVLFGNERIGTRNWNSVAELIMKRCNQDAEKHVSLMNLRDEIFGRKRVLLSREVATMHSPIKIDENLYIETHYDAETLMRTLLTRIPDAVDFDYSNISVSVRNSHIRRG